MINILVCPRKVTFLSLLTIYAACVNFTSAQDDEAETIFELPEFTVQSARDIGYQATNSMTGTFLDTPLKNSPFAIDVFTLDLITDTGSTDMREILAYDSGLQLDNTIAAQGDGQYALGTEFDSRGINNSETDIVTRGFRAPTLKNGFFTQTRVDTVNIGRLERAGGPQSLLYGIGSISGITNVITKRPLPEARYFSEAFVGSDDFYRLTAEATGPVLDSENFSLNYIVSGAFQDEGTEFPLEQTRSYFLSPAFELRAWEGTSVYVNVESGWRKQEGTGPRDAAHPRAGLIDPRTNTVTGTLQTDGQAQFLEHFLGLGRYVNLGGPDTFIDDEVLTSHVEITQRLFDNYRLLIALNRDEQQRDERMFALRPEIRQTFLGGGEVFDDLLYGFGDVSNKRVTEQARVALLASYEFLGGQHTFVLGRQDFSQSDTETEFPEVSTILSNDTFSVWPADGSSIRFSEDSLIAPRWENFYNEWYQGHYLIYQGSLWKGRINPVIGYRWDRSQTRFMRRDYLADGSLGEAFDPLVERGSVNGYGNGGVPFEVETPTYGLSVSVTEEIAVYGTYAEGIALSNIAQRDGLGRGFPPEFSRNREIGVKGSFFDGKVSGRISYFNLQKRGGVRYSFYAPNVTRGNFNPDEPITAALRAGSASSPQDLRRFMEYLGLFDPATNSFAVSPLDLPGVERDIVGGTPFFIFPFGDPDNPGSYDAATNSAPAGYGQDLLDFIEYARELDAAGVGFGAPQYMWAGQGNHPGEDRGGYHNFNEESSGYEVRLQLQPIEPLQLVFSYTYNTIEISNGLSGMVDPAVVTGIEPWFWYLPQEDFADPKRPSTYNGDLSRGVSNTDVPAHSFTFWGKYEFLDGWLEGFDIGVGARYTSERAAESPWSSGGGFVDAIHRGAGENVKAPVPDFTLWDLRLGYEFNWRNIDWTINLNIRNVLDKQRLSALADNREVLGVPALTEYYLPPRDVRLSIRAAF
jgi:outer membrane receptor protein involved in Fe transport